MKYVDSRKLSIILKITLLTIVNKALREAPKNIPTRLTIN